MVDLVEADDLAGVEAAVAGQHEADDADQTEQIQIGAVYGITTMDNGYIYINTVEYPFHYELSDTVITVLDTWVASSTYTVEVE